MSVAFSLLRQTGVSFVEVLISLLILAFGVLGMMQLHKQATQHNTSAYAQSQATLLAADMMNRIQSNRTIAKTTAAYQSSFTDHSISACEDNLYPDQCEITLCDAAQLALYDIKQWKFNLQCQIPNAQGQISFTENDDSRLYSITIKFPELNDRMPLADLVLRGGL